MKLTDRMEKILDMCGREDVWADIGCDHGRISTELVLRGKADKVIAADISELSLYKAMDLSRGLGLSDKVECRCGDGMKVLSKGEARGVVITGMGAPLIERIIGASMEVSEEVREFVLSPNNYPDRLRSFLIGNGFEIACEYAAEDDGRFYPVIKALKGEGKPLSKKELYCGRAAVEDECYIRYIEWLIKREEDILKSIEMGGSRDNGHLELLAVYKERNNDINS